MRYRVTLFGVLFSLAIAAYSAPLPPPQTRSAESKSGKSCLACHDSARLAELQKKQGPEIIPEDPHEREAFAGVMSENDPGRRRALAESFISTYPQSWMLE